MKLQKFTPILALAVFILASCSKKDTTPAITYRTPTSTHAQIAIPAGLQAQANKDSIYAIMAVAEISVANIMGTYAADFVLGSGENTTATSNGAVYSWTYGDLGYWMTYSVLSDKYTWTWDWKTAQIPRFTYLSAEELKNGSGGNWKIYDETGTNTVAADYTWTLTGSVYNATMNFYSASSATTKYVIVDNGNNSGSFQVFEGADKKVQITWNTDGTGNYWFSDNGYTGTWTATGK